MVPVATHILVVVVPLAELINDNDAMAAKCQHAFPTCIIHTSSSKEDPSEGLVSPQDISFWSSFLAHQIREHLLKMNTADCLHISIPNFFLSNAGVYNETGFGSYIQT